MSVDLVDRLDAMLDAYRDGATLTEIGARHGVSRQRVHQLLCRDAPDVYATVRAQRRDARLGPCVNCGRTKADRFVTGRCKPCYDYYRRHGEDRPAPQVRSCAICGRSFAATDLRARSCSPLCTTARDKCRYYVSGAHRTRQRVAQARWVLAHPDHPSTTPSYLAFSLALLAQWELTGTVPAPAWRWRNGTAWRLLVEAAGPDRAEAFWRGDLDVDNL